MDTVTLKLLLTPALIGAASLAGRRWGPGVSGWIVGLPLTSGPIAFFLAVNEGVSFARTAAVATLVGAISQALFCLTYGRLAPRFAWPFTLACSVLAFAASTAALRHVTAALVPLLLAVVVALVVTLALMPGRSAARRAAPALPSWDIPARMVVATAFVVILTGLAPALGPRLTGLLAPFPLYGATLAVFAHRFEGAAPAATVLRGLVLGLFAFAGFFVVLAASIERVAMAAAFGGATLAALVCQGGSLWWLRRVPGCCRAVTPRE